MNELELKPGIFCKGFDSLGNAKIKYEYFYASAIDSITGNPYTIKAVIDKESILKLKIK